MELKAKFDITYLEPALLLTPDNEIDRAEALRREYFFRKTNDKNRNKEWKT